MIRLMLPAIFAVLVLPAFSSGKGLMLITRGHAVHDFGPVKDLGPLPAQLGHYSVGFKYSYFGIFWLDLWRGSGEYCLHKEKEFNPIPKPLAAALLGVSESELSEPFFYDVPPGLIVVAALVVGGIGAKMIQLRKKKQVTELANDPRYAEALDIFRGKVADNEAAKAEALEKNEAPPAPVDPLAAAVDSLVSAGIERSEAEREFVKMLTYAMQRANQRAATGG